MSNADEIDLGLLSVKRPTQQTKKTEPAVQEQTSASWSATPFSQQQNTASSDYLGGGSSYSRSPSGGGSSVAFRDLLTGRQSTTTTTGGGALPTMGTTTFNAPTYTAPTYNAPSYDYNRINYLTTQQASPGFRKARNALYTGIGKVASTDNPWMQGQARKQLMQGYGESLTDINAGAARTAQQLYNTEYQGNIENARTAYQGALSGAATAYQGALTAEQANFSSRQASQAAAFQAALAEWQKSLVTTTTEQMAYNNQPFSGNYSTGGSSGGGYLGSGLDYNDYVNKAYQTGTFYNNPVSRDITWR
jgi:hypothetical protein